MLFRAQLIFSILFLCSSLRAQDASTPAGQTALEHHTRFYAGAPVKKFSGKISSLKLEGDRNAEKFTSAPAIYDGAVYIGTDSGSIYSASDGLKKICHLDNGGSILGAPLVTKESIFAGFSNNLFAAFSREDGKLLWKYETKGAVTRSPVLHEKFVYFTTTKGYVYSLYAETGQFKWRFNATSQAYSPIYDNNVIIVGNESQQIYAINAKDGNKLWDFFKAGGEPLLDGPDIFGSGHNGHVYSVDKTTGYLVWTFPANLKRDNSAFAIADNKLVFANGDRLMMMDSRAGEGFKWQKDLHGEIKDAPIIAGDVIYALDDGGILYAFDLATGAELSRITFPKKGTFLAFSKNKIWVIAGEEVMIVEGE